ncbi:unnamed protein product [Malus baccata var. baccata]
MNIMMTKPVVRVNMISILEACRNKAIWPQFTRIFNFKQQPQLRFHNCNNNPCVDLYFHCAKGQDAMSTVEFHETLMNQVLPSAWSHNPLTTLKLICNFIDKRGNGGKRNQDKAFFTAAVWLYQNHPKTLACDLVTISGSFGHILDLPCILSQVLPGEARLKFTRRIREEADSNGMVKVKEKDAKSKASDFLSRRKMIHKAAQRDTTAFCTIVFQIFSPNASTNEIDPDDDVLLPHDILSYIKYPDIEQETDVKWKKMVEVYLKEGKLKNWLAVCDVDNTLSAGLALGLLLPQLSDEPWKGKTLMKSQDWTADFGKVFDTNYEEIRNKYKKKGYADVVPHLVIWNMIKPEYSAGHCREPEPGVTLLSGFSYKLLEFFLKNDGDIGPNHDLESAVSAPAYQILAVVD